MAPSSHCLQLIKDYEGFSSTAYLCPAGVWTIGYGFTSGVKQGDTMTQAEAENRLKAIVNDVGGQIVRLLDEHDIAPTQGELDALTSFAYNTGLTALQGSTLFKRYLAGDKQGAANEFDKWVYSNGRKLKGLQRRRAAEKELFLS